MLVLTRKAGQKLVIGDIEIEVVVINARGEVQLGITAPKSVKILRGEVAKREAG